MSEPTVEDRLAAVEDKSARLEAELDVLRNVVRAIAKDITKESSDMLRRYGRVIEGIDRRIQFPIYREIGGL